MGQSPITPTNTPRRVAQELGLDGSPVYPRDEREAVLSEVEVLRESLSILPIVAIEELI